MSHAEAPRTVILSDLHLGRAGGALRARAFEPIIASCDRLIVNGDAAELHHVRYQSAAERELDTLRDLCATRGVRLDLIAGNHDPFVSDNRAMHLADGAVYITHGDAMHDAIAPWSPCAASMQRAFTEALRNAPNTLADDAARFRAAGEAALAEWREMGEGAHISTIGSMAYRPHRLLAVVRYWIAYPRLVADWAARFAPGAGTVVVGHSHRAFAKRLGGRMLVNTGSYGFPGKPHAVVLEGPRAAMHAIELRGTAYALAASPRAAWQLESCRPDAASTRDGSGRPSAAPMNRAASHSRTPSTPVL